MIVIIGAGALGSHVAMILRNIEKQTLKVVDFDKVEQKNIQAQFHTKMGLRRNKAQALAQAMQGMFDVKIEAVPHKLTADNALEVIGGPDLLIDCTDNIKARKLIATYADTQGIPCLHGALSADGTFGRMMWSEEFTPDAEGEEGEATCEAGEALPFFVSVAAMIAIEAQRFLKTGKKISMQFTPTGAVRLT